MYKDLLSATAMSPDSCEGNCHVREARDSQLRRTRIKDLPLCILAETFFWIMLLATVGWLADRQGSSNGNDEYGDPNLVLDGNHILHLVLLTLLVHLFKFWNSAERCSVQTPLDYCKRQLTRRLSRWTHSRWRPRLNWNYNLKILVRHRPWIGGGRSGRSRRVPRPPELHVDTNCDLPPSAVQVSMADALTFDWPDPVRKYEQECSGEWHPRVHFPWIRQGDFQRLIPRPRFNRESELYLTDNHIDSTLATAGDFVSGGKFFPLTATRAAPGVCNLRLWYDNPDKLRKQQSVSDWAQRLPDQ